MIKSVLVITLFSLASVSIAQTITPTNTVTTKPAVQFGLKGGLNMAKVKSDLYENIKSRESFYVGGLAHIHLNPHFAVQPEITYSRQGFELNLSSTLDFTGKLDYVNIPVLFQYMNKGVRVETGPQIGFLVNSQWEYTDGRDDDTENRLKSTDFSWDFGVSYLSTAGIGASVRYNLGISNINKDITRPGVVNTDINNRVWQFGLFYQFNQ